MTDEANLLRQARAYDPVALGELYDRYAPKIYAYLYRRVGDAALAEDLTGELFVRMLQAIQNERAWRDSLRAWLYRIAHNLVVDHYRSQPAAPLLSLEQAPAAASPDDPADEVEDALAGERIRSALQHLTPDQQHMLALRYGEGLKVSEIAQVMQKTVGAVESLQHRALAALRRILAGDT